MTDLKTDAETAIADTKAAISALGADEVKAVAWYKNNQFWAGMVAGVVACAAIWLAKHFHWL